MYCEAQFLYFATLYFYSTTCQREIAVKGTGLRIIFHIYQLLIDDALFSEEKSPSYQVILFFN